MGSRISALLAPLRWRGAAELMRRVRAFGQMPLGDKLAIAPAWLLIGAASALILLIPFARLAPLLGRPLGATSLTPLIDARQKARARFVQRAIARAAALAPFRADCLPQALAGALLCRWLKVPAATHLGVQLGDADASAGLRAHAWVDAGEVRVTGGRGIGRFTVVACFVAKGG